MARLLLLASLAISASGCFTLDNQREGPDKDPARQAGDEILELRDGGPKAADATKSGERHSTEQQVRLRIMLAEIERPEARALGFDLGSAKGDESGKLPWLLDDGALQVAMKPVLEKLGRAHVLAEHTLVAQDGKAATCLLGGAFDPIKYVGVMLEGVSSLPFGVHLNVSPTMMDGNRICLYLHAHIAVRDLSAPGILVGAVMSGVKTRHLKTTIEMSMGQAFAVAGLVKNDFVKQPSRLSFLAGIPILDRLVETDPSMIPRELVLLVTPEIVQASKNKE